MRTARSADAPPLERAAGGRLTPDSPAPATSPLSGPTSASSDRGATWAPAPIAALPTAYVELEGTFREIIWAEVIRARLLPKFDEALRQQLADERVVSLPPRCDAALLATAGALLARRERWRAERRASRWVERRHLSLGAYGDDPPRERDRHEVSAEEAALIERSEFGALVECLRRHPELARSACAWPCSTVRSSRDTPGAHAG